MIGIPLLLVFGANAAGLPGLNLVLPWSLVVNLGPEKPALAIILAMGQPLPTVAPVIGTVLMIILFILIAIVRFEREEF